MKWTELTWEEIHDLPINEFHELAEKQKFIFPDLLEITDEKGIIDTFYHAYKRKRV